jgi:hypothetical protein
MMLLVVRDITIWKTGVYTGKNSLIGCKIFWVMMLNVELNYLEWCIPYEDMTSPERLDWTNPL